jgi:hypothetical protein
VQYAILIVPPKADPGESRLESFMNTGRNHQVTVVTPRDGETFHLEELQELVGGYVENVRLPDPEPPATSSWRASPWPSYTDLLVHEDAKIKGWPVNHLATMLWGDTVAGPALLMRQGDLQ